MQLLRQTGAHFSRDKLDEAGTELCRWDIHSRKLSIYSNPSYIADPGTTSCPTVTQTEGMPPGNITLDQFCISASRGHTGCYLSTLDTRHVLSRQFPFTVSKTCLFCTIRYDENGLCPCYRKRPHRWVMKPDVIDWFPWCAGPVLDKSLNTTYRSPIVYLIVLTMLILWNRAICRNNNCHVLYVSLAASGDLEGLEIWSLAGADLNKPGYDGQTAIQVVGSRDTYST